MDKLPLFIYRPLQRVVVWFRDLTFRKLLQNATILFSGNIVATILGIFNTVLQTRTLGVTQFGLFAVILAYFALIEQLSSFSSWQALIKYGAGTLELDQPEEFIGQVKFSFILDLVGGALGVIIATIGIFLFANLLGLVPEIKRMTTIFCLGLLFNFSGTPIGVLRLLDKFVMITTQNIVTSIVGLSGSLIIYLRGGNIWDFLVLKLLLYVAGNSLLIVMAYIELRKRQLDKYWLSPITNWKPFLHFSIWTWLVTTMSVPIKQLDVIIAGVFISVEAAGIYKILKQIVSVFSMMVDPISQAVYPQFAAMVPIGDHIKASKYAIKVGFTILAVIAPISILVSGTSIVWLPTIFGAAFYAGWIPLVIFSSFVALSLAFSTIHPLFLAMGYAKLNFGISFVSNMIYLAVALLLMPTMGLNGLCLAYGSDFIFVATSKFLILSSKVNKVAGT